MVVINDKYMSMRAWGMMVEMAMRFRPLPPFMLVLMMFIVVVPVGMAYGDVLVLNNHRVTSMPDKSCERRCRQGHRSQQSKRPLQPKVHPQPACQRIGDQPTAV